MDYYSYHTELEFTAGILGITPSALQIESVCERVLKERENLA